MRFLLIAGIWSVFLGGIWLYTSQRDSAVQQAELAPPVVDQMVYGPFSLEITTTFDTETDPFALAAESAATSAIVRLNGQDIVLPETGLHRGSVVRVENISGILEGYNDIYLEASPPLTESVLEHGVRLKIFAKEELLLDRTVWGSSGALVSDSFGFKYSAAEEGGSHE